MSVATAAQAPVAGTFANGTGVAPSFTPDWVEERLRKAVVLQAALNTERLVADIIAGRAPENRGIIGGIGLSPDGRGEDDVIDMATESMSWLRWLAADDAGIVAARLAGAPWKSICWRFEISRPTADRRWRYALAVIAWRLNGNAQSVRSPSLRSLIGIRRAA